MFLESKAYFEKASDESRSAYWARDIARKVIFPFFRFIAVTASYMLYSHHSGTITSEQGWKEMILS